MTPEKIIDIALRRAGLTSSSSDFKDNAREYLNLASKDITGYWDEDIYPTPDSTNTISYRYFRAVEKENVEWL